ncbi:MAG: precorrin-8X methylmutase [Deltaproteobacteria bacterium]|nr:precorrin-8X methylmutase [Deltaproteobacteria bacterium]
MKTGSQNGKGRGILLLGHGSKVAEANETLRRVAAAVEREGGYPMVLPAFLQMERPDFREAVDTMVERGCKEITVMPYFLYSGAHVTKDLPSEISAVKAKYPDINVKVTGNLGYHGNLIDIIIERVEEAGSTDGIGPYARPFTQHPIEKESFRIIEEELGSPRFSGGELEVLKRVVHSTADFGFKEILRFSPGAMDAGISAIRGGGNVITDVRMSEAGISKDRLGSFGGRVFCFSSDKDVIRRAASEGVTKTAASMRKAAEYMNGGIVAIGNAPTALLELLKMAGEGAARPALVIGVPVGFVGAAEAKEALKKSGLDYIVTDGRKGGSTVAVAIVNAIVIQAAIMRP